jgi:iron complex outermembrane receptor protein
MTNHEPMGTRLASRALLLALLASTASVAPCVAWAADAPAASQTAIEEVVVTARRVEENIQKVPIAITAISQDALEQRGITDPIQVQFSAPSLQSYTTYNRLVGSYAVRGIAGTGNYFAEVPGGPTSIPSAPLYDMQSIQVLNGPQGTLFGRTSIAGAVLFEPRRPEFNTFGGEVAVFGGNLGMHREMMSINIPVIDDHLAIRIAADRYHLDGFTKVIGSGERLNETNNEGARISINWKPGDGKFTNYTLLDYVGAREASSGWVLTAYNPNLPLFHLPANINAPNGLALGTQYFGAACASAFSAGIQSSVNGCIDQRLKLAATWLPAMQAEIARQQAGGDDALRYTGGPANAGMPLKEFFNQFFLVNQTQYDFGDLGFTTLTMKNIFGMTASNGSSGWQIDGIGGTLFSAISGGGGNFFLSNSSNQMSQLDAPAVGYLTKSPYVKTYTDEFQVRGMAGGDLLAWNVGGFYSKTPLPTNTTGIQNIARTFGGVNQPNLGFQPSYAFQNGGHYQEKALYGQATLDLSRFAPFFEGLHATGGLRKTWSDTLTKRIGSTQNITTGAYSPTAPIADAVTSSEGTNRTLSLDAQVTKNLLVYGTTRTAYVPGGVNTVVGAEKIFSNYKPTYAPQTVKDYEVGVKSDFRIGDAAVRIGADVYRLDFSNIQQTIFAAGNGVTATFVVNAAAARMQGFELQTEVAKGPFDASLTYSYTDAKFTDWQAPDPLGLITVGNPACLPTSPAFQCFIDMSKSAFPNIPKHKIGLSVTYELPLNPDIGQVRLTATGAYQTERWFSVSSTRNVEAFGPLLGKKQVEKSQGQPAYGIANLRAEWKGVYGSPVTVAAFVNNLFDKNYAISGLSVLQSLGPAVNLYGDPRTFGLELRYAFGAS